MSSEAIISNTDIYVQHLRQEVSALGVRIDERTGTHTAEIRTLQERCAQFVAALDTAHRDLDIAHERIRDMRTDHQELKNDLKALRLWFLVLGGFSAIGVLWTTILSMLLWQSLNAVNFENILTKVIIYIALYFL